MTLHKIALIGDGIENPLNARTMIDTAGMFGTECMFTDRAGLTKRWLEDVPADPQLRLISNDELARTYDPLIVLDNLQGATDIYGFRFAGAPQSALVAGNERKGISDNIQAIADYTVQIPMFARKLNSLNVAAASAVALYYLTRGGGAKLQVSAHPSKRRPELMMLGAQDHVELGSAIRSAGAFGWERVLVEDRAGVWFGSSRHMQTEGRAAARRARNPLRLIPTTTDARYAFDEACVITLKRVGTPIHKAHLARGPRQLVAIPDESLTDVKREDWHRLAKNVRFVHLDLPRQEFVYHYRLIASIALAEVARQVGQKARPGVGLPERQEPFYDSSLEVLAGIGGQTIFLEDLECY
jgi:SpoU rRNA Methylase family